MTSHTGLEVTGGILETADGITSQMQSFWFNYVDNIDAREEAELLKAKLAEKEREIDSFAEEKAELKRLRAILSVTVPESWDRVVTRVIATKLGAFSVLETVLLDKGYLSGAVIGRPLMTDRFIAGRIYKAGPSTSLALLLEDYGCKIAVIGGDSRQNGILNGAGEHNPLEIHFINQDSTLKAGEILYTSGFDNAFPKGIPVARVLETQPLLAGAFQVYYAEPLADFSNLEELTILIPPVDRTIMNSSPVLSRSINEDFPSVEER